MSYFVSSLKDGKVRKFAYPHVSLQTALALAAEVLLTENSDDVWVSDETGQKVAERSAILDYADGGYAETDDEN
jgi:hypothetical protein